MTYNTFIRFSGWGLVAAAISLLLTFSTGPAAFLVAILFVTTGLGGLYARYGEQIGMAGKLALGIGVLGGMVGAVSSFWLAMGNENGRPLMVNAMAVMFAGLFVFGLFTLRTKPMAYGNGLPLLAGFIWPLIVIGTNIYHQITGHWLNVPGWLSFTMFLIMGIFLAWLGFVLQADASSKKAFA